MGRLFGKSVVYYYRGKLAKGNRYDRSADSIQMVLYTYRIHADHILETQDRLG